MADNMNKTPEANREINRESSKVTRKPSGEVRKVAGVRPPAKRPVGHRPGAPASASQRPTAPRPAVTRSATSRPVTRQAARPAADMGVSDRPRAHKSYERDADLQFDMYDITEDSTEDTVSEYDIGETRRKKKSSGSGTGTGKKKKKSKKAREAARRRKSRKRFLIFLGCYTAVLLILGGIFLGYTDSCLNKYEAAQSQYEMAKYFEAFKTAIDNNQIPPEVNLAQFGEASADITSEYMAFVKQGELKFEKDRNSYNTEEPVYNILSGDTPVHSIKLRGVNEHTIFGILTIMDWEKAESISLYSPDKYEYYVRVPEGFTVNFDGKILDSSYQTENAVDIELFQFAREYVSLPNQIEYKVDSFRENAEISITDNNGNAVEAKRDDNVYTAFYLGSEDIPDDLRSTALNMAETWSKFMTSDLSGNLHGFYTLEPYLIKGSYYHSKAKEYAGGIDITFISGHTLDAEPFSNIKVDDYVRYNENCFSCHIYFEKVMHLNRGTDAMDVTDSTFIFAYYDDFDDGVDNPHWAMVDMIANTN